MEDCRRGCRKAWFRSTQSIFIFLPLSLSISLSDDVISKDDGCSDIFSKKKHTFIFFFSFIFIFIKVFASLFFKFTISFLLLKWLILQNNLVISWDSISGNSKKERGRKAFLLTFDIYSMPELLKFCKKEKTKRKIVFISLLFLTLTISGIGTKLQVKINDKIQEQEESFKYLSTH